MIIKRYKVYFENFVNKKKCIGNESPPKTRTVAETSGLNYKVKTDLADIEKRAPPTSLRYLCNIRVETTTNYNSNETYAILFQIYSCITY